MEKAPPTKQPRYGAAFRAEALRLASESRSPVGRFGNEESLTGFVNLLHAAESPPGSGSRRVKAVFEIGSPNPIIDEWGGLVKQERIG